MTDARPAGIRRIARIDLDAFASNLAGASSLDARADGYGHGLALLGPVARDAGVASILVSDERDAAIARPLFGEVLIGRLPRETTAIGAAAYGLDPDAAARPVLTDTVYRRQKHPFLSPPATLNPDDRLHEMVQDALRGSALRRIPYFDQGKVVDLLDRLPSLQQGEQVAMDQVLMLLLSAAELGERFELAA